MRFSTNQSHYFVSLFILKIMLFYTIQTIYLLISYIKIAQWANKREKIPIKIEKVKRVREKGGNLEGEEIT